MSGCPVTAHHCLASGLLRLLHKLILHLYSFCTKSRYRKSQLSARKPAWLQHTVLGPARRTQLPPGALGPLLVFSQAWLPRSFPKPAVSSPAGGSLALWIQDASSHTCSPPGSLLQSPAGRLHKQSPLPTVTKATWKIETYANQQRLARGATPSCARSHLLGSAVRTCSDYQPCIFPKPEPQPGRFAAGFTPVKMLRSV